MNIAIIPSPFAIPTYICHKECNKRNRYPYHHIGFRQEPQNVIAIEIVSCQHAYKEKECVNSSSQWRFRIHRNYSCQ